MAENTDDAVAVTGRPNDIPVREPDEAPLGGNSTFASRAKARSGAKAVRSGDVEDKAVTSASTKRRK